MKTILLTGATGFVGGHAVRALLQRGFRVLALMRPTSDRTRLPAADDRLRLFTMGELRSATGELTQARVHAIVNCAVAYGRQTENIAEVIATNIELPLELLHLASRLGTEKFINLDSFFSKPNLEHDYLPQYTASKREFLRRAAAVLKSSATTIFNLRLEHVYGPGDSPAKFIPWLISSLLAHKASIPLTSGSQQRDFLFVSDVVDAILQLVATTDHYPGEIIEVQAGTGIATSVRDFATLARRCTNSSSTLEFGTAPSLRREIQHSVADTSVLQALGWKAKVDLKSGLAALVAQARRDERNQQRA